MAMDESEDKLDDGVVGAVEKTDEPELASAAAAAAAVAARRRLLLDPLFRLGGVNLASASLPAGNPAVGRRSLCEAEEDACDAVDVDGIGPLLSESRTTGFDELLRELLPKKSIHSIKESSSTQSGKDSSRIHQGSIKDPAKRIAKRRH